MAGRQAGGGACARVVYGGDHDVSLERVARRFGAKQALERIDLTVRPGTVCGFIGPNGAGKTTMLRVLLGLVSRDAGVASVLGHDPQREPSAVRAQVGVLLDHDGHYDRLTAAQNLRFHARAHGFEGREAVERVESSLKEYALWDRRDDRVQSFSKGMRQKLAVARALLHRPKLVLLDEPFTGLDPAAAIDLRDRLRALSRAQGTTVLLTTHDLHHVERVCDDVTVIRDGKTVAAGTTQDLLRRAATEHVDVVVAGEGPLLETLRTLREEGTILGFAPSDLDGRLIVTCTEARRKSLGTDLVHRGVRLLELSPERVTLEQRFVALVSSDAARREAP